MLTPQRDLGTGETQQVEGPMTYESPVPGPPTGEAEQSDNVTYEDFSHLGEPTGEAEQVSEPVTVHADWPRPQEKAVEPAEPENKAVTTAARKRGR